MRSVAPAAGAVTMVGEIEGDGKDEAEIVRVHR
jgi:hypothetical protein